MSPALQRVLGVGLVIALVTAIAGIVTLAAMGRQQPVELLGLPAALIVAISTGQLFLGHQGVVTTQTNAMAGTIQALTSQIAAGNVAGPITTTTPASAGVQTIPPSSDQGTPTTNSGSETSQSALSAGGSVSP